MALKTMQGAAFTVIVGLVLAAGAAVAGEPAPRLPTPRPQIGQAESKPAPKDGFATASLPKADTIKPETAKVGANAPVFAGIPFDERIKIQAALFWSGDYAGATNGEDPMLAAVKNYQKRAKGNVTGVLTPVERAALVAAAQNYEKEFGWSVVVDPATGIRIGLPTKMVPQARDAARGTRWSSAYGEVQVETFRIKDPNLKLAAVFEQEKREPATRRVEYSVLNDDGFFISGIQGLKKFSVRAKIRDGEVRGFTLSFDQMMETIVSPMMVAMASAFSPFPERSAPFAALAKSVEYGNGVVVSERGHIVTDRRLTEGCQVIVAAGLGDAERVADDKDKGLALLRVYGPRKLSPVSLAGAPPKSGDMTLIGIPDPKEQGGTKALTEVKARLADEATIELQQPVPMAGFSGAAAIDAQGHFLGVTEMRNFVLASTEPAAPPVHLVSADTIRAFLNARNVEVASTTGPDAKASVVRIICVRK
ncbi:serine protease [Pseudolabrys taiwanensis]|uniref:serine protease n=1 Tax=Pseudolabrys taiwanensis TaxID=331696 RepID=UPI0013B3E434|nr:serine protease [Pseudolabrys taiwanensis]